MRHPKQRKTKKEKRNYTFKRNCAWRIWYKVVPSQVRSVVYNQTCPLPENINHRLKQRFRIAIIDGRTRINCKSMGHAWLVRLWRIQDTWPISQPMVTWVREVGLAGGWRGDAETGCRLRFGIGKCEIKNADLEFIKIASNCLFEVWNCIYKNVGFWEELKGLIEGVEKNSC